MLRAFRQSGRTAGFRNRKAPAGQHQIAEGKQRKQLCRVLGQPPIASFAMTEQVLDDMKRMLDFRPHARLQVLQFFRQAPQFVLGQRFAFGALHGHMPRDWFSDIFRPLFHTLIAGVTKRRDFIAVQQRVRLRHVGNIAGRADNRMHQTRRGVHADVRLHPKVPVIAFFRLVHFRIALAIPVLRRRRRGDQRGVDDGSFAHHQAFLGQVPVDGIEDLARKPVGFQEVPELQQRRRVRRRLAAQVNSDEGADGLAVIDRIFNAFVRQAKALLGHVHAQHARQSDRRAASAFDLRIERLNNLVQFAPRRHAVDLGQEAVAPRQLLLGGVFEVGKALLHDRWQTV